MPKNKINKKNLKIRLVFIRNENAFNKMEDGGTKFEVRKIATDARRQMIKVPFSTNQQMKLGIDRLKTED